jgi:hypothetical protein
MRGKQLAQQCDAPALRGLHLVRDRQSVVQRRKLSETCAPSGCLMTSSRSAAAAVVVILTPRDVETGETDADWLFRSPQQPACRTYGRAAAAAAVGSDNELRHKESPTSTKCGVD